MVDLFRSRQQPVGCAPLGRTSCGSPNSTSARSVLRGSSLGACPGSENPFTGVLIYSAHASSLRLRSAGAHFVRRPVGLASARSVLRRNSSLWLFGDRRTGCLIPLTPAAFGCAPLGRTSCGGQSALPQHVPCFGGIHHYGCSGPENGARHEVPSKAVRPE